MSHRVHLSCPDRHLQGVVSLEPSKSLSNRALIIRSLCGHPFDIHRLSTSDDTRFLHEMLEADGGHLFAGHAGTAYRFMLARACLYDKEVVLDGAEPMRRRPIGPLVEALRTMGADIEYLGRPGYPPVRISPSARFGRDPRVTVDAGISSQFVSALMLIAPALPEGLAITLAGEQVSQSYTAMTMQLMRHFGVEAEITGQQIVIPPGGYEPTPFTVESDWSGASYFFSLAALADAADIQLEGLSPESWQGDAVVAGIYSSLGVTAQPNETGWRLKKSVGNTTAEALIWDFRNCPDLAQTVMTTLAGLGVPGHLTGLKTLPMKETHRLEAMRAELAKVGTALTISASDGQVSAHVSGQACWRGTPIFDTYEDHRMAMSMAPLACLGPIAIQEPEVVSKSFPDFWRQIRSVGVNVQES